MLRFEAKRQDCWVGVYWKTSTQAGAAERRLDIWICLLPCLPIHVIRWSPRKGRVSG